MIKHVIDLYQFNLNFAHSLVKDISLEQMVQQPHNVVNHPAWTLGHLVMTANGLTTLIGLEANIPEGWDKIFITGSIPSGSAAAYPAKEELLSHLSAAHERNATALKTIDLTFLDHPHPNEKLRKHFPTIGALAIFLMTSHEMDHLGQLAAWRRAMGLGAAPRN